MNNKEYEQEDNEGMEECCGGHMGHMWHFSKKHKKEFKLAMLEKKEKMLQAKLDFIRKIKDLMAKSDEMEDKE